MHHTQTERPETATVACFAQEPADLTGLGGNSSFLLRGFSSLTEAEALLPGWLPGLQVGAGYGFLPRWASLRGYLSFLLAW